MFKHCRKAEYQCNVSTVYLRKAEYQCNVFILGNILKQENTIKYEGIIITNERALHNDIERTLNSFLRQFNSMYLDT